MSADFDQRHSLFDMYDEGCLLDEESWFSVTPEAIAHRIAWRSWNAVQAHRHATSSSSTINSSNGNGNGDGIAHGSAHASSKGKEREKGKTTVVDAFCGAGGNAIQFALFFDHGELCLHGGFFS